MNLINWLAKKCHCDKDEIVFGLVFGLVIGPVFGPVFGPVYGLVFGPVFGPVFGLVISLVSGLVSGLVIGLVIGPVFGLVIGLVYGLVYGLINILKDIFTQAITIPFLNSIIVFIILPICIAELIFFLVDKSKPKPKESKIWFTVKRKFYAFVYAYSIIGAMLSIYQYITKGFPIIRDWLSQYGFPIIRDWLSQYGIDILNCIGWGTLIIVCIAVYIYLNSLKYRRTKKSLVKVSVKSSRRKV